MLNTFSALSFHKENHRLLLTIVLAVWLANEVVFVVSWLYDLRCLHPLYFSELPSDTRCGHNWKILLTLYCIYCICSDISATGLSQRGSITLLYNSKEREPDIKNETLSSGLQPGKNFQALGLLIALSSPSTTIKWSKIVCQKQYVCLDQFRKQVKRVWYALK